MVRDRRPVWRLVAGLSALAVLGLVAVTAAVVLVLSAGGPAT